jgi:hypothetical protein
MDVQETLLRQKKTGRGTLKRRWCRNAPVQSNVFVFFGWLSYITHGMIKGMIAVVYLLPVTSTIAYIYVTVY